MSSPFHKLPSGISLYQIEKCIPLKWRQNIKPLVLPKKSKRDSFFSDETIIGLDEIAGDNYMVDCLLITLKDLASRGHLSKAFRTFSVIQRHAVASGSFGFIVDSLSSLLLSCTKFKLLQRGKQLHALAITWGLHESRALVPKLVSYYTSFGFLDDAHFIVSNTNILSPIPWNILISSYVNKGCFEEAIYTYEQMCCKRIRLDSFTYPSVIKACAELSNLDFGREVHQSIKSSSLSSDVFVQNALVSMYGKCGDLEMSRDIFNNMSVKDAVSWNTIISEYASRGMWDEAFKLFEIMRATGVELNIITWNTVAGGCLKTCNFKGTLELICHMREVLGSLDPVSVIIGLGACSHLCALKLGKEIHGLAIRNSSVDYDNVNNALITFYSRCGDLTRAYIVFRSTVAKSIITWNSMISGFAQRDRSEEATFLFRELLLMGTEPNYVTLAGILPLCARVANLKHGKELHCYIAKRREFQDFQLLWNSLIDIYARSDQVFIARRLFDLLDKKDAVTYTSLIAGYGIQGNGKDALILFQDMINSQIKPDQIAMVAVLSACSHSGLVAEGNLLFQRMQTDYGITPLVEHFACMADLYGRAGLLNKAKQIILQMPYEPTCEMWATLVGACRIHWNTDIGEWAAEKLMQLKPQHSGYYVLIANMYAAAGCWNKLVEVRTSMRDLGVRKDPGCAWIDIGAGFSPFVVEDTSSDQVDEIFLLLEALTKQMKDIEYVTCANSEAEEVFFGMDYCGPHILSYNNS